MPRALRAPARAFAEALFTTNEGPPPAERLDWLMDDLDDYYERLYGNNTFTTLYNCTGLPAASAARASASRMPRR